MDAIKPTLLDRAVSYFFPTRGLQRIAARDAQRAYLKSAKPRGKKGRFYRNTPTPGEVFAADGRTTRARAIDISQNQAQVSGAITAITDHTIGAGGIRTNCEILYSPSAQADNAAAQANREASNSAVEDDKARWLERAWHTGASRIDHVEAQTLRLRNLIIHGEDIVHRRFLRDPSRHLPLAYEPIDPAQLEGVTGTPNRGNLIESGIEYNPDREIVAYHIADNSYALRTTRVPADDIIHTFRTDRPGQQRGITWLAPIMGHVDELEDIVEYSLIARRIQSAIAVLVHKNPNNIGFGAHALESLPPPAPTRQMPMATDSPPSSPA